MSEAVKVQITGLPKEGMVFELEIDGDMDPMLVVSNAGRDANPWRFLGPAFPAGKRVYMAKLIEVGDVADSDQAAKVAKKEHPTWVLAPGQARDAFADKFPRNEGRPIVFGGNQWQDEDRRRRVACLHSLNGGSWSREFDGPGDYRIVALCLWLVIKEVLP
jgi:hypothetical protein